MTTIFETKTEYLNFIAAWKAACNSPERKSYLKPCDEWIETESKPWGEHFVGTGKVRIAGWLQSHHHILYNLIRGREPHSGFSFIKNRTKLENGGLINSGLYEGYNKLQRMVFEAKQIIEGKHISDFYRNQVIEFLKPFNETISIELLSKIELENVKPVSADFGKGREIAKRIFEGEIVTWNDIKECY